MKSSRFILVVADDDDTRNTLAAELSNMLSMQVVKAQDGVMAYQKTRNQDFAAVVSEFNIKKLNGAQLINSARETKLNANTPFIFYTEDIEQAKTQTRGLKGVAYFQKPCEIALLAAKITELTKKDITKKTFSLDVDFINPFIDASLKTLKDLCGLNEITAGTPYLFEDHDLNIDISGLLSISSPYFRGSIAVSFNNSVYDKIVAEMLKENKTDIEIKIEDGVKEIINIIFGQTKAVLNNRGYLLERAVPDMRKGHNHELIPNNKIPILLVPFQSNIGDFWIQICVKAI